MLVREVTTRRTISPWQICMHARSLWGHCQCTESVLLWSLSLACHHYFTRTPSSCRKAMYPLRPCSNTEEA